LALDNNHSPLKSKFYYFFRVQEYWWAVMLIAIGLILFMGLFIKVCAVHTPSSNPKAPPAQHWGDTLRRRRSRPRQQQQRNPGYGEPLQESVCIVMEWMCIRRGG